MPDYLSARKAADYCGVNERTIRNWIVSGRLPAERDARGFRIRSADLEALRTADSAAIRGPVAADGADSADSSAQLLALVDRLSRENVELAGRCGFYQARNRELEERVKLLSAGVETGRPQRLFWRKVFGFGFGR